MLIPLVNLTEKGLVNMLEDLKPKSRLRTCRMRQVIESLSESDQRILKDAVASPDFTSNGLMIALRQRGIEISYTSVRRHELRHCSCGEAQYA